MLLGRISSLETRDARRQIAYLSILGLSHYEIDMICPMQLQLPELRVHLILYCCCIQPLCLPDAYALASSVITPPLTFHVGSSHEG